LVVPISLGQRLVRADSHPVPDIDGANSHQQPNDLVLVEEVGDLIADRIRHVGVPDEGDRLGKFEL
jgi:hypothetical protein